MYTHEETVTIMLEIFEDSDKHSTAKSFKALEDENASSPDC